MGTTTSSRHSRPVGTRAAKKAHRSLGIVPFSRSHERDELIEFEHAFVYGIQELIGFLGRSQTVDLAPCYAAEELARKRDSDAVADTRDLLRTADAKALLTGAIEATVNAANGRIDALDMAVEIRVPDARRMDRLTFDLHVRNVAPRQEPERFLVDVPELLSLQRQVFLALKRRLKWRYLGGPARRKYYDYRMRHPLTRSYDAYRHFVRARRMAAKREEKLGLYKRSLRHDPCLGHAYRNIGYLYKEAKELETAVRYYRQAVTCLIDGETLADAWAEMGLCHANRDRIDEAIRCWHVSRRWNRENKDVYANLAIGYEEKGRIEKAIRFFERAQRIDPHYYWACRGLGRIYAGRQEWKKAIEQIAIQLRIAPEDAWGHYTLGNCYYHEGVREKARSHCRRAVELDPHGDAGRRAFQLLMEIED